MGLILSFGLPTLLGMLFQQFYNLMDTMIVGKLLGAQALAAVGSTSSINFFVIGFCMGVCNGFAIPVAQRMGAGDYPRMRRHVANAAYPRLTSNFLENNIQPSTFYLRNAAYLRLKTAEVGYTFTPWLRAYVAGTNLLTFSPFDAWDPEMGSGNGLKYPLQRTVKIGVQFHY